jgi:hypothetical protein
MAFYDEAEGYLLIEHGKISFEVTGQVPYCVDEVKGCRILYFPPN